MEGVLYEREGYTVTLTENHLFKVDGPETYFADGQTFASMGEAQVEIERLVGAAAKRAKRKMALEVYSDNGTPAIITGLHATRGVLLTKPSKIDRRDKRCLPGSGWYGSPEFYPRNPIVLKLLAEQERLGKAYSAITEKLNELEVDGPGGRIRPETFDDELTTLENVYAEAKAKAEALAAAERGNDDAATVPNG